MSRRICHRLVCAATFAVCAFSFPSARAQATASGNEYSYSKVDLYAGYGYFKPFTSSAIAGNPYPTIYNLNTTASLTYWFTRRLGAQIEGTYFSDNRTSAPGVSTTCATDSTGIVRCEQDENVQAVMAGIAYRMPLGRWTPFVHALGGAIRANGPVVNPLTTAPGFTGGLGIDYTFNFWHQRLAVRPIQADMEGGIFDYGPLVGPANIVGGQTTLLAVKLSGGLVLHFGLHDEGHKELMLGCTTEPASVFAGEAVTVSASTLNVSPRKTPLFSWSTSGGRLQPAGATATVDTTGLAPGDYIISGRVSEGSKPHEQATCTSAFSVRSPLPPTLACTATPSSVVAGGTAQITAVGTSPQNRPLTYSFSTGAGQLTGAGSSMQLATVGVPASTVDVTCNVMDDLGKSASAHAQVTITVPAVPQVAAIQQMCTLDFASDHTRPARVNNESKACLDDIALTLNRESTSQLEIVGNAAPTEKPEVAAERALNVRQYMTQEKGIDPSRIEVRVGDTSGPTVNNTLVPAGATFTAGSTQTFDETTIVRHGQAYGTGSGIGTPAPRKRRRHRVAAPAPVPADPSISATPQ